MGPIIQMLITMLPTIIKLFDKPQAERVAAQPAHDAAVRAAVKSGDWFGIVLTGVISRLNKMPDDELQGFLGDAAKMESAMQAYAAQEAEGGAK